MFTNTLLLCLELVCGLALAQSPVSSCQDRDTTGCRIFQQATPDLCNDPSFAQGSCKRFCGNCPRECYDCPNAVYDPDDCNTTSVCGEKKTCVTKHLIAIDGHHEYLMTCESKTICVGLKFGFGKRAVEDFGGFARELGDRAKRSIAVDCCDTDFCNYPLKITTTTFPTTTTLAPGPCVKDLVFVLDDSGSVGRTNFKHALDFVSQIVNHLDVGPAGVHVSVMASSSHQQIKWYLNTYSTKSQVLQAVHIVKFVGGTTNTAEAIHAVREEILNLNHGDRPAVENTVIVLTNGQSSNRTLTAQEAMNLKAVSKDVISIGVGDGLVVSSVVFTGAPLYKVKLDQLPLRWKNTIDIRTVYEQNDHEYVIDPVAVPLLGSPSLMASNM